jgi:hypothetical protein
VCRAKNRKDSAGTNNRHALHRGQRTEKNIRHGKTLEEVILQVQLELI